MTRQKPRSLYWTFAGAFLAVVVVATLLQGAVLYLVFSPLFKRVFGSEARTAAVELAREIEQLDTIDEASVAGLLRGNIRDPREFLLLFRFDDGRFVGARPVPMFMARRIEALLAGEQLEPEDRPVRVGGRPRGRDREERGLGRPDLFRGGRPQIVARETVQHTSGAVGEVVSLGFHRRFPLIPAGMPLRVLIFLPIAMLVAAIAGMMLFRALIKRIRRLELVAIRVAEGDLEARVVDPGSDEIGRLGDQFNRMTQNLALARKRIIENESQRHRLLADVSHELATPLTSIRGYAETMLNPEVKLSDDERRTYVGDVLEEAERLDRLVQDLFELAQLEAASMSLVKEPIELVSLCRRTIERFGDMFANHGITASVSASPDEAWIDADGRRLEQVLDNLMTNALRYVPAKSSVAITVTSQEDGCTLSIEDNGPGFPPDEIDRVFERFYRGDSARSTRGTGLGLAIVREIVERHGGTISAENRAEGGARILIFLPVK